MGIKVRMSFVMSMELFVKEARFLLCVNSKLRKASFTLRNVEGELYYKFSVALCFCELQWNNSLNYNLFMSGQLTSTGLSAWYMYIYLSCKSFTQSKGSCTWWNSDIAGNESETHSELICTTHKKMRQVRLFDAIYSNQCHSCTDPVSECWTHHVHQDDCNVEFILMLNWVVYVQKNRI